MRQEANQPKKSRRRHCKCCDELFDSDPRAKEQQRYCSKAQCQTFRQRQNEKDWCRNNPEAVAHQKSKWQKKHPEHSGQRRAHDPELAQKNRQNTKIRMQNMRANVVFDKSKPILTQVVGRSADKCCLMRGNWLFLRLTRASPWTKAAVMRHTSGKRLKRVANRLPKSKLYDLTGVLKEGGDYG
jgi:hypothetical protein